MITFPKLMSSTHDAPDGDVTRRSGQMAAVFSGMWLLAMIAVPIARWTMGDEIIPLMSSLTVILQFLAVFNIGVIGWGVRRTTVAAVLVAIVTFAAEYIGSKTGFPFGIYSYTASLQPQLGDVPLVIPLAWFMMLLPSWAVASLIVSRLENQLPKSTRYVAFVILSAAAISAWDLFLDPQMVGWGFWEWQANTIGPGNYFGIPWSNYAGWFLTGILATLVIPPTWLTQLPKRPLIGVYTTVWLLQTIGLAFFWQQPGPSFFGFIGMGVFSLTAMLAAPGYLSPVRRAPS